jgi:hypothetical protein
MNGVLKRHRRIGESVVDRLIGISSFQAFERGYEVRCDAAKIKTAEKMKIEADEGEAKVVYGKFGRW